MYRGIGIVIFGIASYAAMFTLPAPMQADTPLVGPGIYYNTPEPVPTAKPEKAPKIEKYWKITAYCPCEECSGGYGRQTATGRIAKAGRTVAVDPKFVKYGSKVIIDGHEYTAEDCGGAVKGNHIDIFFDTHTEVEEFGRKQKVVKVRRNNG